MGRLTEVEIATLLTQPLICYAACIGKEGYPSIVPLWFHYADGGFYLVGRARAAWASDLQLNPRVSLCVDAGATGRILVEGDAQVIETPNAGDRWVAIAREMAECYLGPDEGSTYFELTASEPRWLFFIAPRKLMSWTGGWAQRYKHSVW